MPGFSPNGFDAYVAGLEARADAEICELKAQLEKASTEEERRSLRARIQQIRDELARKKAAAAGSLF